MIVLLFKLNFTRCPTYLKIYEKQIRVFLRLVVENQKLKNELNHYETNLRALQFNLRILSSGTTIGDRSNSLSAGFANRKFFFKTLIPTLYSENGRGGFCSLKGGFID